VNHETTNPTNDVPLTGDSAAFERPPGNERADDEQSERQQAAGEPDVSEAQSEAAPAEGEEQPSAEPPNEAAAIPEAEPASRAEATEEAESATSPEGSTSAAESESAAPEAVESSTESSTGEADVDQEQEPVAAAQAGSDEDATAEGATLAEDAEGEQSAEEAAPEAEEAEKEDLTSQMDWYILKVQSNREDSIAEALQRRVSVAGLDEYFGQIIVPVEMVTEFKGGKKRVVRRKLYPGYIVAQMVITDDTWFLVRETPGIGDFTGAGGKPTPMLPHEVERIVPKKEAGEKEEEPKFEFGFAVGDRVKINEGTFENFEGEVSGLDAASGRVTVMINIFGRSTPVQLENWQVEAL